MSDFGKTVKLFAFCYDFAFDYAVDAYFVVSCVVGQKTLRAYFRTNADRMATAFSRANSFRLKPTFVVALGGVFMYVSSNLLFLNDLGNTWVQISQVIGVLGAIGTLIVLYNAVHTLRSKRYRIWGKLQAILFVLASFGFLWLVLAGNLLSFTSNF